jgi:CHAD domain-containing protein
MGFRLEKDETVGSGFQRILREQTARLSEDLASADKDLEKAIHEVRKRCKRVRAVARLLRPNAKALYRKENAAFRDIARGLSPFRDADVRLQAFDDLVGRIDEPERFAAFREMLGEHHRDDTKLLEEQLSWTAKEVHAAQERLKEANMSNGAAFKLIEPGLLDSYKRGGRAMSSAYDKPEETAFHEWRKRVKDLGYQTQTLRDLWPPVLKRLRSELDKLGDLLGKEHDLTVVRKALLKRAESGIRKDDLRALLGLVEQREFELQAEAQTIGRRVYAEKPRGFVRRMRVYWETWQAEIPAPEDAENNTLIPH